MRLCAAAWPPSRSWPTGATSRPIQTRCRQSSRSSLPPRRSRIQTIAEMLDHIGAQIIAHGVGIPVHAREKVLHAIGASIAGGFGQMPAVLALERGEQALQIGPGASARLDATEAGSNPGAEIIQLIGPTINIACVRHGSTPPCLRQRTNPAVVLARSPSVSGTCSSKE